MDTQRNPSSAAPVFALAYCHRDADAARRWLAWVSFLSREKEPVLRHDLVVMRTQRMKAETLPADIVGVRVVDAICPDEDERGYPGSATHLFIRTLEYCNKKYPGRPVMFCEADTVALRPDWMDAITEEYAACGKPFMGQHVTTSVCPHMAGCGVYPAQWRNLAPLLAGILQAPRDSSLFGKDKGQAWDIYAASDIEPQMAHAESIQQIWKPGWWLTEKSLGRISRKAALFHQDKEGSLIRLLAKLRYGNRFKWDFDPEPARFFMLESPTDSLIIGGALVTKFRKVARCPSGFLSIHEAEDPAEASLLRAACGKYGLAEIPEAEFLALQKQAPMLRTN